MKEPLNGRLLLLAFFTLGTARSAQAQVDKSVVEMVLNNAKESGLKYLKLYRHSEVPKAVPLSSATIEHREGLMFISYKTCITH